MRNGLTSETTVSLSRRTCSVSSTPSVSRVFIRIFLFFFLLCQITSIGKAYKEHNSRFFTTEVFDKLGALYPPMRKDELKQLAQKTKEMFQFGYDNYIIYAFPMDELDPIHCDGRGPDYENPENININDVLGDYCLTLVDALDTLAVMGNKTEFHRAVGLVLDHVSFQKDNTVQVFEATIRVLGALLSAHLILVDPKQTLGDFRIPDYNDELLSLAHDLASRLLPAFENTATGIPHPRVNLMYGVPFDGVNETCTSGAGSLLLEFGVLSRLVEDPTYEGLARRTNVALWNLRDKETGLLGNNIDIQTGEWVGLISGLGAGIDSFFEYLLKSYILFGTQEEYRMFNQSYSLIKEHLRRGRPHCNAGWGDPPLYVNVHMRDGTTVNTWIDSLQASFAGVQILNGDLEEAICQHAVYYAIWRKYGFLPERFNWQLKSPDILFYPLRPEFIESTYLLYLSTKNPFYLHVGKEVMENLEEHTRVECGYATIHNVHDKSLEDRMESFFLSETCKYLFLLFDLDNPVNKFYDRLVFTTEGHILPVDWRFREPPEEFSAMPNVLADEYRQESNAQNQKNRSSTVFTTKKDLSDQKLLPEDQNFESNEESIVVVVTKSKAMNVSHQTGPQCENFEYPRRYMLPLQSRYLKQLYRMVGVDDDF